MESMRGFQKFLKRLCEQALSVHLIKAFVLHRILGKKGEWKGEIPILPMCEVEKRERNAFLLRKWDQN